MTAVEDTMVVRRLRRPPYAMILSFPTISFVGALLTDIAYWQTANLLWSAFSSWLLLAGLVLGGFSVLFGLIECLFVRSVRTLGAAWTLLIGNIIALVLSLANLLFHMRDGWTAVFPWGLALSAVVVALLLIMAWQSWVMVYRHRLVGVI